MKRIKKIVLLLIIILLSGCSVEYNVIINEDSSVNEKVVAKEMTKRMKIITGLDEKKSVNYLYNMFDRKGKKTRISTSTSGADTISTVTCYHSSLNKYKKSFDSDVFEKPVITENGNIVTITYKQKEQLSSSPNSTLIYDSIVFKIKIPFKVVSNNANSINKDVYSWNIKKDEELKTIKISYDKSDYLYKKEVDLNGFKLNIRYDFMIIGSIILIVAVIAMIVFINNKKNNRV